MIAKLKEMYNNLLVEDVQEFDNSHYYFYDNGKIFGISKTISNNEYKLLKKIYIEKPIYNLDKSIQTIYDYIYENAKYPFKTKKVQVFIYQSNSEDANMIDELLESMLKGYKAINIYDYKLCFYEENVSEKLKEIMNSLSFDLGYVIKIHELFGINDKIEGSLLMRYIAIFNENKTLKSKDYSHFTDMIMEVTTLEQLKLLKTIKTTLFDEYFNNQAIRDMILVMINNDLNVSSSAKLLYMNRNSLINKLDSFYKETGLNLQRFTHACAIYFLMQIK